MTRQDMAVMLFRCTERMGIDTTVRGTWQHTLTLLRSLPMPNRP